MTDPIHPPREQPEGEGNFSRFVNQKIAQMNIRHTGENLPNGMFLQKDTGICIREIVAEHQAALQSAVAEAMAKAFEEALAEMRCCTSLVAVESALMDLVKQARPSQGPEGSAG